VKRSTREGDLKETLRVNEMSSISTLEVAWEHYPWGTCVNIGEEEEEEEMEIELDETWFCFRVAQTNKLELLEWMREEKECEWDYRTIDAAAFQGNLEMVKYCVAKECPIDRNACACAALEGHLEVLKYLREEAEAPWDSRTANFAAENGHLHILEYLVERKFDQHSEDACVLAAKEGHLDCLKYLRETAKAPWNSQAVYYAREENQTECLQYLLDNNCPLPFYWRYEGGTLYDSEDEELYELPGL
jgi:hypothetical protein